MTKFLASLLAVILVGCGASPPAEDAAPVTVPDVIGETDDDASERLDMAGIKYRLQHRVDADTPAGRVISTDPGPGAVVEGENPIRVVVSISGRSPSKNRAFNTPTPTPSPSPRATDRQHSYEVTRRAMRGMRADLDREHHAALCDLVHSHGVEAAAELFTQDWSPRPEPVAVREFFRDQCLG